jgi:alkylmercury lyase
MTPDWHPGAPSLDRLHDALVDAFPRIDGEGQRVGAALYRLLASGEPITPGTLGHHLGWVTGEARRYVTESELRSQVEWDGPARNRIVGFGGLTTRHSRHSLLIDGRRLSTWCAWDALFIPEILGAHARVESVCPVTGEPVRLLIAGDRMERLADREPVVSFKVPDDSIRFESSDREILEFCSYVNLFASRQAGTSWISTRPGTFLLTPADAFTLARRCNATRFGILLRGEPSPPNGNHQGEVA